MHKYRLISKKGEGTFSEVLKAQSIKNNKFVAIKCMKNHFDSIESVNNLREIQALQRLSPHPNIINLYEVLYDKPTGRLALVFELMDMNIYEMIRGRRHYLPAKRIKSYTEQLLMAIDHMHRNGIFHRDIKPENILIKGDLIKLADFGSCRGVYSRQPYTEYISTRWYRAPECLLTDGYYGHKMDLWGVGCVMFEVIALFPLFPGENELDQLQKIHKVLGNPDARTLSKIRHKATHIDFHFPAQTGTGLRKLIPHVSKDCATLIERMLSYDVETRISAKKSLQSPWFRDLRQQRHAESKGADNVEGGGSSSGRSSKSKHVQKGERSERRKKEKKKEKREAKEKQRAAAAASAAAAAASSGAGGNSSSAQPSAVGAAMISLRTNATQQQQQQQQSSSNSSAAKAAAAAAKTAAQRAAEQQAEREVAEVRRRKKAKKKAARAEAEAAAAAAAAVASHEADQRRQQREQPRSQLPSIGSTKGDASRSFAKPAKHASSSTSTASAAAAASSSQSSQQYASSSTHRSEKVTQRQQQRTQKQSDGDLPPLHGRKAERLPKQAGGGGGSSSNASGSSSGVGYGKHGSSVARASQRTTTNYKYTSNNNRDRQGNRDQTHRQAKEERRRARREEERRRAEQHAGSGYGYGSSKANVSGLSVGGHHATMAKHQPSQHRQSSSSASVVRSVARRRKEPKSYLSPYSQHSIRRARNNGT